MSKRFLIYGESWVGCHGQLLYEDLKLRKYEVKIFDHTFLIPGIRNRSLVQRIRRRLFIKYYNYKINKFFLKTVDDYKPEIILICKGLNLKKSTLKIINNKEIYLINWNPDDFFNKKNSNAELINSMSEYDLIISSRPHLFNEYKNFGVKELLFIDWYFVPDLHKKRNKEKKYYVSFVGSWSFEREKYINSLPHRVSIWGGGWEKSSKEFKYSNDLKFKILSQEEMSIVFEESTYNLNFITQENRDLSNLRFFEVPASGGLLVTERNESAKSYFVDGQECIMFSSIDELVYRIDNEKNLETICDSGYKKIHDSKNSFECRVNEIISFLEKKSCL